MARCAVESVKLVLIPHILKVPRDPDGFACIRWPALDMQLRFQVHVEEFPVSMTIPQQDMSLTGSPRVIPEQNFDLHARINLMPEPQAPSRRLWFGCGQCRRMCGRLYLPDEQERFLCRVCYGLWHTTLMSKQEHLWRVARRPEPPTRLEDLRVLPLWMRWHFEGKGGFKPWYGEKWEATKAA